MSGNTILTLTGGTTTLEVWTIGARLNGVSWGGFGGLVDGSETVEQALGPKLNHGSVVGPVANRIAGAAFELDGVSYKLEPNEAGGTICHSGAPSLRGRVWDVVRADEAFAHLAVDVADMADGFPGNRRFEAVYSVDADGFELRLSAVTDAPTLVNMALHPYWTLEAGGRDGLRLQVNADRYLPVDAKKIPTGEVAPVAGTVCDLRVLAVPGTGIDHNFCLSGGGVAATLASDRIALDIETDAPGLQVYTGNPVGIALEPQHWPDAPHHAAFPSIRLEPGHTYSQTSRYRFRAL